MDLITLGRTLGFSFAAGVNLYATVAILGLAARYGWVDLPAQFQSFNPDVTIPIVVCPPGVDVPASPAGRGSSLSALIVGRMASEERYKGHDVLLDLWPRVLARVPGALLTIAGDGDDRGRLERRAHDEGLAPHIRFTGRVTDRELRDL